MDKLNTSSKRSAAALSPCCQTEEFDYNSCQLMVDNSDNILSLLKKLYDEKSMCDVYLNVAGKEYGTHRLILCASSEVFHVMLMKREWTEWHESKIELQELKECEPYFNLFLEYFYTGKLLITHTNVMPILALADKYIVKGLSRLCLKYMSNHVPHAASHNQLFSWLNYAQTCGHVEIIKICQNYLKWNFELVANTPDFTNIDPETLIFLLKQNDLVVYNEMVLYNCVVRWLNLQKVRISNSEDPKILNDYMKYLIETVMGFIRFPMMSPRELADLLLSPLIKQHKEFFVDRMSIGMSFHSGHSARIESITLNNENEKLLFTPRLYTLDSYSSMLTLECFKKIPFYQSNTFLFNCNASAAECNSKTVNWTVTLYPKGVWFRQCFLIVWQGTVEVPEKIIPTVRISLTCQDDIGLEFKKFKISILIYGIQGGVEHIMDVKSTIGHFNSNNEIVNIDNIVPFELLNPSAIEMQQKIKENSYLVGDERNIFKLRVVVTPIEI